MYSFSYLEPVYCSMSSSNCCFLTCIQISQEAGQVVWYSHLVMNFPQFIVIHTVKGFGVVNKAEIDVFLKLSCFFKDLMCVGNLISGSSGFSKSSLNIWNFIVHILLKPGLENFEHYFTSMGVQHVLTHLEGVHVGYSPKGQRTAVSWSLTFRYRGWCKIFPVVLILVFQLSEWGIPTHRVPGPQSGCSFFAPQSGCFIFFQF